MCIKLDNTLNENWTLQELFTDSPERSKDVVILGLLGKCWNGLLNSSPPGRNEILLSPCGTTQSSNERSEVKLSDMVQ